MKEKQANIISKLSPILLILFILIIWQLITVFEIVPNFMLPSPIDVLNSLSDDSKILFNHSLSTLLVAFLGLTLSIIASFFIAIIMERFSLVSKTISPLITTSQTIPTIAIAPLLILWFGFGILPKVILVFITCFFPLTINIYSGLKSADNDIIKLYESMNASKNYILTHIKLPYSLPYFFTGLKISVTYAIVGAVISEWLGGNSGLGVYMTRVRKAYQFDKMFAVIFIVSILSLLLIHLVKIIERKALKNY